MDNQDFLISLDDFSMIFNDTIDLPSLMLTYSYIHGNEDFYKNIQAIKEHEVDIRCFEEFLNALYYQLEYLLPLSKRNNRFIKSNLLIIANMRDDLIPSANSIVTLLNDNKDDIEVISEKIKLCYQQDLEYLASYKGTKESSITTILDKIPSFYHSASLDMIEVIIKKQESVRNTFNKIDLVNSLYRLKYAVITGGNIEKYYLRFYEQCVLAVNNGYTCSVGDITKKYGLSDNLDETKIREIIKFRLSLLMHDLRKIDNYVLELKSEYLKNIRVNSHECILHIFNIAKKNKLIPEDITIDEYLEDIEKGEKEKKELLLHN